MITNHIKQEEADVIQIANAAHAKRQPQISLLESDSNGSRELRTISNFETVWSGFLLCLLASV